MCALSALRTNAGPWTKRVEINGKWRVAQKRSMDYLVRRLQKASEKHVDRVKQAWRKVRALEKKCDWSFRVLGALIQFDDLICGEIFRRTALTMETTEGEREKKKRRRSIRIHLPQKRQHYHKSTPRNTQRALGLATHIQNAWVTSLYPPRLLKTRGTSISPRTEASTRFRNALFPRRKGRISSTMLVIGSARTVVTGTGHRWRGA